MMVHVGSKKAMFVGAAALAIVVSGSTGALAQNCGSIGTLLGGGPNAQSIFASGISATAALAASITAANTAFLTQSTAFVSAQPNPQPGDDGGGVWTRGVGGELNLKSSSSINATASVASVPPATSSGSTTCAAKFSESFGGFQVGQDVAKLNIGDGWNIHLGTTAGAIESSGNIVGGSPAGGLGGSPLVQVPFSSTAQSPFVGTYLVATRGNFFVDGLVRYDNYDTNLNSPGSAIFNQRIDAHGYSASVSAGYNYHLPDSNWFVEPSAGLIVSRTTVDPLSVTNPAFGAGIQGFSGTAQINAITSDIGRVGLRVGTTVETGNLVLQPFVAASIWHDFAGNITATYNSCSNCAFLGAPESFVASMGTTNVGTFGQYSVGVSGQIVNTGWLGFVRLDYRNGDRLESLSGTGGIRYQFLPDGVASANMPVKAPLYKAPPPPPVSWTGLYIGGYGGVAYGRSEFDVPSAAAAVMNAVPPFSQVSPTLHTSGILAGGTLGYNWQIGTYVLGIEGDGGWTNTTGSVQCAPLTTGLSGGGVSLNSPPFFQTTCHDDLSWIATVAGRIGYLWDPRTLFYLKGGAAWAKETWSATCNLGPLNGTLGPTAGLPPGVQACTNPAGVLLNNISASEVRLGGLVGFGTEFALTRNWSAKGEFDWIDFGTKSLTLSDGTAMSGKQYMFETKIGLNYHITP